MQDIGSFSEEGGGGIERQATTIITLTASVLEEERVVVLSAGCDDFLGKPFREADIFATLHQHIGVRYIYENQTPVKQEQSDSSFSLRQAAIASPSSQKLPKKWIVNLKQAILYGNFDLIYTNIEPIRTRDAALANALTRCVDNFELEKILTLIQENGEQDNSDD